MIGQKYGRLTVLEATRTGKAARVAWLCQCDCGGRTTVDSSNLKSGHTKSCGCLQSEQRQTHGLSRTKEYRAWINMKSRCSDPNSPGWANYGGRGIQVCVRWQDFENFLADVGPSPSSRHSLDRIDVNGHYSPDNCRWALHQEQARNTRANHLVTIDGKTITLAEAVERSPVPYNTVLYRIKRGWSVADAITRPQQRGVRP